MENRIHRVGSITFGIVLVLFGMLYLVHMFLPQLSIEMIFRLWPCILIILGIEVLLANCRTKIRFVYDKMAIVLTFAIVCFSMFMAGIDFAWQHAITEFVIR